MNKYYFNEKESTEWLVNLPKKSVATKAIIKSDKGNILLVKPNYKKGWQFPGGGVEAGEEPKDGLIRELKEEINIHVDKSELKLLDTVFRQDQDTLILIYEYTILLNEKASIQFQNDELEGYKYETPKNVGQLIGGYYDSFWRYYIVR